MISSALRYGTTDHLYPHVEAQTNPASYYDNAPEFASKVKNMSLNWKVGDFTNNLTEMLRVSYNAALNNLPALKDVYYDFRRGDFVNSRNGRRGNQSSLEDLLRDERDGSHVGDAGHASGVAEDSRYRWGSKTAARAVIFNTVLRESSAEKRGELLAGLLHQLQRGLDKNLQQIFYSEAAIQQNTAPTLNAPPPLSDTAPAPAGTSTASIIERCEPSSGHRTSSFPAMMKKMRLE